MKHLWLILALLPVLRSSAAEVIPPAPTRFFNDYARVVSPATANRLNQTLEDFERESSSQIIVAVFPKMQSDSSIEDYTVRVARAWRAGQKEKNNGAVLFVFVQDRKMYVQVGYGLEGVLPDAICKRIIDEQIAPRFKAGDFDGGLTAGVQSLIAAAKGEYQGTGRTIAEQRGYGPTGVSSLLSVLCPLAFLALMVLVVSLQRRRGMVYRNRGWMWTGGMLGSGGWGGGWSGGGGGFSGGGGGGFSGGGGSYGGGGAGGSW